MLLLLMMSLASFAGPRSFQQAKEIALRQAAQLGISVDETSSAKAKAKRVKSVSGEVPAYYVFPNGEGKGFTVVSGDDRLPEVVGYSDRGTYDEENLPSNYVGFMKAYEEMVGQLDNGDSRASASVAEAKALRSSGYQQPTVAPLLGSIQWNQMTPYNNMCPMYNSTDRSVTGCVATAMSQVMMYYQYPTTLQADIPAYVSYSNRLSIPQINKGETYDWDNMLPKYISYDPVNYTDAQATAIAKLMYHCGAACEMDYGSSSGANVTPAILSTYFGYDSDLMQDLNRDVFTLAEWSQIMDKELTAKRPILYSGQSSDGGHEFVCDGTDGNGLYHINWGWGGYQDGYFDVTILNPDKGGAGSGNAPDGYNQYCSMIIGIAPDNGKVDEPLVDVAPIVMLGSGRSSLGFTKRTRAKVTDTFRVTTNSLISNQAAYDFTGYFAYGIKQADGTYKPLSTSSATTLKHPEANGTSYQVKKMLIFDYAFPVGKTTLYGLYSTDGVEWKKCSYLYMSPFVVEATERTIDIAKTSLSADIVAQDELLSEQNNTLMLTVSNDADFEHLGIINVYTSTTNEKPSDPTEQIYFTIESKGSSTREVTLSPSAGDLYVWVTNASGEDLMTVKKFAVAQSTAPQLVLVGKTSNATAGDYELEKANYSGNKVKALKVNDDKAVFTYQIRNDGGTSEIEFPLLIAAYDENGNAKYQFPKVNRRVKSGETTTLTIEVRPEDYGGNRSFCCTVRMGDVAFDTSLFSGDKLYLVSGNAYYHLESAAQFVYVAGTPSGISSITTSGATVSGGNGEILISSDKAQAMCIYNLSGQVVNKANVKAGESIAISVPAGLYIVNGKKVIVK